jgi:cytochrome c-type biogenesis protein CcmE
MTGSPPSGRRRGAIVGLVVIAIAFGWLVFGGLDRNVVYFLTPAELLAKGSDAVNIPVRLGGQVKPGSVEWNEKSLDLRFTVVDESGEVRVASVGAPPQMFRGGMGVVVEGRYGTDGVFKSTNLMIKHSNEYRAPAAGERPQEMYKTLFEASPK